MNRFFIAAVLVQGLLQGTFAQDRPIKRADGRRPVLTDALSAPLPFVPVSPCRLVDTRSGATPAAGSSRTLAIPQLPCGIPGTAVAYSLNITVVPTGPLSYLTVWPTGSARPNVSTLNSFEGRIVANAALVPAGTNGAIDFYVTDRTDVVIDINGYFGSIGETVQLFTLTPCRIVDTRAGEGKTGAFGPPTLTASSIRDIPVPSGSCGIPANARAYSVNITVVPRGPLSFLTLWPNGQPRPSVSTLNSFDGRVVANAALVPAGANGAITVFVTDATDVIIDINGYLAQ